MAANPTLGQPRLGNGTFSFKRNTEAIDGLLTTQSARDPEDILDVPPEQRIGLHYQGTRDDDGDPVDVWTSGSGHYEVRVGDENIGFYVDGDLHRHGGPAHITADGQEDWYWRGIPVLAARPFDLVETPLPAGGTRHEGVRSIPNRPMPAIARDVRSDLADLDRIGFLPGGATVSVTSTQKGSRSVNVRIGGLPKGSVMDRDTLDHTDDGRRLHDHIVKVVNQYNQFETGRGSSKQRRLFFEEVHLVEE